MKNVLILAAGNISNKLSFIKSFYSSPALIPINTKPLVLYHLEFYKNFDCKVFLVVNNNDSEYIEKSVNLKEFNYEIIEVPHTHGVNASLHYALSVIPESVQTVVNLVTTIPIQFPGDQTVIIENQLSYNNDWSGINETDSGTEFLFKSGPVKKLGHAFTGLFSIKTETLKQAVDQVTHRSDLMEIFAYLAQSKRNNKSSVKFVMDDWIDAGHEINYYQSKLKLISSRSFNSVSVSELGILKKQSKNHEKLKNEADYITVIPPRLSILFPKLISGFEYDPKNNTGSYSMEFYGYPSIAELQLFWDLKDEVWTRLFMDLETVVKLFIKQGYSVGKQAYMDFYVGKIGDRVNDFYEQLDDQFKYIITDDLNINGTTYKSFHKIQDKLFKRIEKLYSEEDFCVVHGDLCFNNILYDSPHRLLKLIDPRGSFGNKYKGVYGDIKYDLAKLLHSAVGGYDYIVNNLYKIEIADKKISYEIFYKPNNKIISEKALQLIENLGYSIKDIMLIVGTLFLTMPPLHDDSCSRQRIMYLHGIKLINENL
jgi:hypothetical protein